MSFESNGSQSSQTQPIPLSDFLSNRDDHHFIWDDANREASDEWLAPVKAASLDPKSAVAGAPIEAPRSYGKRVEGHFVPKPLPRPIGHRQRHRPTSN